MEKTKLPWDEFFSLNKDINHTYFTPEDFSGDEALIAKRQNNSLNKKLFTNGEY